MTETERRRHFQRIKSLSNEKFWKYMNVLHTRAYTKAENHYQEAMDIVLTPKQKAAVVAKANEIRELWDGMPSITLDATEDAEMREMGV